MAHITQMWFFQNVKTFFPEYFIKKRVLEIGSLDINGTCRDFFTECDYLGIDIGPGPGVDLVIPGQDYSSAAQSFDVTISTEVFEHTLDWDLIFINMLRLTRRDGLIIFSCASLGRQQHGTSLFDPGAAPYVAGTSEHYYNLNSQDFLNCICFDHWFDCWHFVEDLECLYFVGVRKGNISKDNVMRVFKMKYDEYLNKRHRLGLPHDYIVQHNLL